MTAMSADRAPLEKEGARSTLPVGAGKRIFTGALVVNDGGFAGPGRTATNLKAVGVAEVSADNRTGANGAVSVTVRRGCYLFFNFATDAVTTAEIQGDCFIVDDQTVAKTDGTGTRSKAGVVVDVEAGGVWVRVGS